MKKNILSLIILIFIIISIISCAPAADVASRNLSVAADNFEVTRRIVFYNGITGEYKTGDASIRR